MCVYHVSLTPLRASLRNSDIITGREMQQSNDKVVRDAVIAFEYLFETVGDSGVP